MVLKQMQPKFNHKLNFITTSPHVISNMKILTLHVGVRISKSNTQYYLNKFYLCATKFPLPPPPLPLKLSTSVPGA